MSSPSAASAPPAAGPTRIPRRETLVESTARTLIQFIARQGLGGGDRLPSEPELIRMIGVSRLPLREALSILKGIGIIEAQHGRGVFVKALDIASVFALLSPLLKAQASIGVPQIVEARLHLEPTIASLAARNRGAEHLAELQAHILRMRTDLPNRIAFINSDIAFHQCLSRAAGNPIFRVFMAALTDLLREVQHRYPDQLKHRRASLRFHARIATAVHQRHPHAAAEAMRAHIEYIAERL